MAHQSVFLHACGQACVREGKSESGFRFSPYEVIMSNDLENVSYFGLFVCLFVCLLACSFNFQRFIHDRFSV